jgi:hypothetical protein
MIAFTFSTGATRLTYNGENCVRSIGPELFWEGEGHENSSSPIPSFYRFLCRGCCQSSYRPSANLRNQATASAAMLLPAPVRFSTRND